MLIDLMYVLNYFAIGWIGLMFLWLILSLLLKIRLKKNHFVVSIYLTVLSFTIFSFNYNPTIYTDLYRHFEVVELIRSSGIDFYYKNELITSLLFNFVASTSYNQLLPTITSLIRYTLFFVIIYRFTKRYRIDGLHMRLFLFVHFAFLPLIESISGIRYYFAITILGYTLIDDFFFKRKVIYKTLHFIPLLVHTSTSMLLGLWLFSLKWIYQIIRPIRYILLIWSMFYSNLALFLQKVGVQLTDTAANLLVVYVEEDRDISINLIISRCLFVAIIYYIWYMIKVFDNQTFNSHINYYRFVELLLLFTVGSIFIDVFFQRCVFFVSFICMPLFLHYFSSDKVGSKSKQIIYIILVILSVGMYMNQVYGLIKGYF